jgi:hypothetical protein
MYLPERYSGVSAPQKPNIDQIYGNLLPQIGKVQLYDTLQAHKDEYIYFRSDHHWTALGAYYAYQQFCGVAGFDAVPLEKMEKRTISEFLGSLYSQTQDSKLMEHPDYVDYYIVPQSYSAVSYAKNQPYTPYKTTLGANTRREPFPTRSFCTATCPYRD